MDANYGCLHVICNVASEHK